MGENFESHCCVRSFHNLQNPLTEFLRPFHQLSGIPAVCPDLLQARKTLDDPLQHQPRPVTILDIGRVDHAFKDQTQSIDNNMPLAPLDFLPRIVASGAPFSVVLTL